MPGIKDYDQLGHLHTAARARYAAISRGSDNPMARRPCKQ